MFDGLKVFKIRRFWLVVLHESRKTLIQTIQWTVKFHSTKVFHLINFEMHSHTLYQSQVHHTGWTPNVMDTHKWLKMIRNVAGHANGILFRLLWHLIEQRWRQRIAAAIEMPGTCRPTGKSYSFIRRLCLSSFSHSISRRVVTDVSLIPGSGSCWTRNGWSAVQESNPLFFGRKQFLCPLLTWKH